VANFILAYANQIDDAVLSAGAWNAGFPRSELQQYSVKRQARTVDAAAASTVLRFALAAPAYIGALGFVATNASQDATYRYRLFSDAGFAAAIADSGTRALYPSGTIPFGQIPFGGPNWWTGQPTEAELARFQRNAIHVLANRIYAQYGELQITDTGNAAGYFRAGRVFVGSVFQSQWNPAYGKVSLRLQPRTEIARARDGTPYFNRWPADLCLPFALDWLSNDEAMKLLDVQAIADLHGEVFVAWDHEDPQYAFRRQVFGRLKQLDPIEHPLFATYATAFQVEGQIA